MEVIRAIGYSDSLQTLTWPEIPSTPVTAHLWGGGGGGGGSDAGSSKEQQRGGNGSGGSYARRSWSVQSGDVLTIGVGEGGWGGQSAKGNAAGGAGGRGYYRSYLDSANIRNLPGFQPGAYSTRWIQWLIDRSMWSNPYQLYWDFDGLDIGFGRSDHVTFCTSVDDRGSLSIDGSVVIPAMTNFRSRRLNSIYLSKGFHKIGWNVDNSGGSNYGLGITAITSYNGGRGSNAGPTPYSGAGGGGGAATVLFYNDEVWCIAGGGAGGGGGGKNQPNYPDAPGPNLHHAPDGIHFGGDGQIKGGDGGGAGGGGGGYAGGNGGMVNNGDANGQGGSYGTGLGDFTAASSNRIVAESKNPYAKSGDGGIGVYAVHKEGLKGENGYAVLAFEVAPIVIKNSGLWKDVEKVYIRHQGSWQNAKAVYIKKNGVWLPCAGVAAPVFNSIANTFGFEYRPYDIPML